MSNRRRKNRWRAKRAASNRVENHATPAGNKSLPIGWSRWEQPASPAVPDPAAWVPDYDNRHLLVAARGDESIGYPLLPPAPVTALLTLPRHHGRSRAFGRSRC